MIIAARNLSKFFEVKGVKNAYIRAVEDVNIEIKEGEIVGLVGESGSGKSTLGRLLIRLIEPTSGEILYNIPDNELDELDLAMENNDQNAIKKIADKYSIVKLKGDDLKKLRRNVGIVFQDPYSSLDPRLKIEDIIAEPLIETNTMKGEEAKKRVLELLDEVQLPREFSYRYPHELSGGQRQRVALARGIATNPKLVILDEPTSALDVSVQAEMLELLKNIRKKHNMAMLLITHNISVVSYMADRVFVMYAGKIMEKGFKNDIIKNPQHPYTKALISAVPQVKRIMSRTILKGDPPNLINPPKGCRFHPRCPVALPICGWTSDEIKPNLEYLIDTKYFTEFSNVNIEIKNELELIVHNADPKKLQAIINSEKENIRALYAIKEITSNGKDPIIRLYEYKVPKLIELSNSREVACWIYSEKP
ncbi:MAG: ABC transporter ATP-binding protein [Caldisphaera sp.]